MSTSIATSTTTATTTTITVLRPLSAFLVLIHLLLPLSLDAQAPPTSSSRVIGDYTPVFRAPTLSSCPYTLRISNYNLRDSSRPILLPEDISTDLSDFNSCTNPQTGAAVRLINESVSYENVGVWASEGYQMSVSGVGVQFVWERFTCLNRNQSLETNVTVYMGMNQQWPTVLDRYAAICSDNRNCIALVGGVRSLVNGSGENTLPFACVYARNDTNDPIFISPIPRTNNTNIRMNYYQYQVIYQNISNACPSRIVPVSTRGIPSTADLGIEALACSTLGFLQLPQIPPPERWTYNMTFNTEALNNANIQGTWQFATYFVAPWCGGDTFMNSGSFFLATATNLSQWSLQLATPNFYASFMSFPAMYFESEYCVAFYTANPILGATPQPAPPTPSAAPFPTSPPREFEPGGQQCFSKYATVRQWNKDANVPLHKLQIGDQIATLDTRRGSNQLKPTKVVAFLDLLPNVNARFVKITFASPKSATPASATKTILLTPKHLIFRAASSSPSSRREAIFAEAIQKGDYLVHHDGSRVVVIHVDSTILTGAFAPLTEDGSMLVDGVLVSCYGNIGSHALANTLFAPLRYFAALTHKAGFLVIIPHGQHLYAKAWLLLYQALDHTLYISKWFQLIGLQGYTV